MTMLNVKAVASLLILFAVLAGLIFASAGTLRYWEGWTFLLVYFAASLAITLDLIMGGNAPVVHSRSFASASS